MICLILVSIREVLVFCLQTSRKITVASKDTLVGMIDTPTGDDYFESNHLVICDECHGASSKTVTKCIGAFHNMKFQFGFTGTLPEDELDREIVSSHFGKVLDEKKLKELENKYDAVSNVTVGMLKFNYGKKSFISRTSFDESHNEWVEEVKFIQGDDDFRNPYIVKTIVDNHEKGRNIVVLVKNIEFGEKIYREIRKRTDQNTYVIFGSGEESVKLTERDKIIKKCKKSKKPYIIVTNFQIFSMGVNIPNLNLVAMVDAGKSKITVAQTIGRGVRKTDDKDQVFILDCYADLKYSHNHGLKRKKLYAEEGFKVLEKEVTIEDEDLIKNIEKLKFS
jgi:superfamily II DNA or RNA helicase